jgi:phosphodiesterase/alkaline phosphatase D-like protein
MPRLILGHTTDKSVKIWVRASSRWPVTFLRIFNSSGKQELGQATIETLDSEFYTATHEFNNLTPDTEFLVKVYFGKSTTDSVDSLIRDAYTEGRFKTFPTASNKPFTFLLGSCNLHSLGILERPDQSWVSISRVASSTNSRFMIHAGDQIYADIPFKPDSSLDHYRAKYLDAWDDCVPAKKVLTELPHYMILDDHEIINDYESGRSEVGSTLPRVALKVYWEFQHSHNPVTIGSPSQYYYNFNYGDVHFFVLDTRTSRISRLKQMIDEPQLQALLDWMSLHKNDTKFVVTSVPFVGVVKDPGQDKWCSSVYKDQRERILKHVLNNRINGLTFLTGDMHTSYCADMQISDSSGNSSIIHELMSSPINQFTPSLPLEFYYESPHHENSGDIQFTSTIRAGSYYGGHSNVMSITVASGKPTQFNIYRTTSDSIVPVLKGKI